MKTILVVSTENHAGKSILSLGLGLSLKEKGIDFAYMKPISSEVSYATGEPIDRDAQAIRSILDLEADLKEIAPVALEGPFLREAIKSGDHGFRERIVNSFSQSTRGRQVALIEGRRYLGLGLSAGLSDLDLAQTLNADVLLLSRYDGEAAIDRILCGLRLLDPGSRLLGVVLNEVAMDAEFEQVSDAFVPFLTERGAEVLGIIPYDHHLRSVNVEEIVERLNGRVVTNVSLDHTVGHFLIAAMGPEAALRSFRRTPQLAVITGGDRVDIQEAALEAPSLRCLVLTGNLRPSRLVINKAQERGVPVIVAGQSPMAAVELCEGLLGHSRIRQGKRLDSAVKLVCSNVDVERIIEKATDH